MTNYRVICKVTRALLGELPVIATAGAAEGVVSEAVKARCGRLGIGYDGPTVSSAVRSELWKAQHRPIDSAIWQRRRKASGS